MKEFRKTEDGLFVCEECEALFKLKNRLSCHIKLNHNNFKIYFDKWIKDEMEGICKICAKPTIFRSCQHGYANTCYNECAKEYNQLRTEEEVFKKFGVKNVYELNSIKEKLKQTWINNYGVDNPAKANIIKEKMAKTCQIKYGTKYALASKEVQKKREDSCLKNYGVKYPMQNPESHEKQQLIAFKAKKYKNTDIYYRGTYEFNFLEKYYPLFPDIINGKVVKYNFEKKLHCYFPDFYIPSLNLIIEIKSSYYYKKYKDICDIKEKATIANGFNYLMILDKNYENILL